MPQKASTPWSARSVAEGGTDSPVGDLVPVPDEIKPVVNTGFIALSGKYTGIPADDLQFTFQDPNQALAAGADMEFPVNMLRHDILILAMLDSSGNDIAIDICAENPTTLTGPYTPFADVGVDGAFNWLMNTDGSNGNFIAIIKDEDETLSDSWRFWKIHQLRGTQITMKIKNDEGANAGTVSTAYLRLV